MSIYLRLFLHCKNFVVNNHCRTILWVAVLLSPFSCQSVHWQTAIGLALTFERHIPWSTYLEGLLIRKMAESATASGFDPAKEFPNIKWNFDNLPEPAAVADAPEGSEPESVDKGLITAPPTPPAAAASVSTPAVASAARSATKATSSAKSKKSTPSKQKAMAAADGSVSKKAKAGKPTPKSALKEVKNAATLPPTTSAEEKVAAKMARTKARRDQRRDRRRQKRTQIRSKVQPTGAEAESAAAPQVDEP